MKFLLKKVQTAKNIYLYDGVSSNILSIGSKFASDFNVLLDNINKDMPVERSLEESYRELIEAENEKLIMQQGSADMSYWFDVDEYLRTFQSKTRHLMIGVTEACNMRCKYCVYGGHYEYERSHSERFISYETARKAVDFFLSMSKEEAKVFDFYGGEPFLNFEVIKEITEYISKTVQNYEIFITTNGTLLTDEVIKWFIENKRVRLFISMAGIPKTHDSLRVFQNNNGTFSTIKNNVLKIRKADYTAYSSRITFVFNIFDERQLFEIRDFWKNEEMFSGIANLPEITVIDCVEDDGAVANLGQGFKNQLNHFGDPLKEYINLLKSSISNDVFVKYYDDKFLLIHRRLFDNNASYISGVCRPFINKVFVDVNGTVHPCENFTYSDNFGSVFDVLQPQSIKLLLDQYLSVRSEHCKDCWCARLCTLCYRDIIDRDGSTNRIRGERLCSAERIAVENLLKQYCTVLENGDDLLDHLYDVIIRD